jgi:hypothetical protein
MDWPRDRSEAGAYNSGIVLKRKVHFLGMILVRFSYRVLLSDASAKLACSDPVA